jgi:toxin ParE1/3/4
VARLIWTEPALADLDAIADYIALDNPAAASRLVQRVFESVERLERFPSSGKRPPELPRTSYRELVVTPCRVFYRVEGDNVFLLYVMRAERLLWRWLIEERTRIELRTTPCHRLIRASARPRTFARKDGIV